MRAYGNRHLLASPHLREREREEGRERERQREESRIPGSFFQVVEALIKLSDSLHKNTSQFSAARSGTVGYPPCLPSLTLSLRRRAFYCFVDMKGMW